MVGYVMACYGGSTSLVSYGVGRLAKYTSRYPLFAASYLLELGALLFMLLWKPSPDKLYINFLFTFVCAASDGIWQTQSGCKYTHVHTDTVVKIHLRTKEFYMKSLSLLDITKTRKMCIYG